MSKIYKHHKRGTYYELLHSDAKIEADMSDAVVYRALIDNTVWIRPHAEFFDGRFVPMIEDPKHEYPPEPAKEIPQAAE